MKNTVIDRSDLSIYFLTSVRRDTKTE